VPGFRNVPGEDAPLFRRTGRLTTKLEARVWGHFSHSRSAEQVNPANCSGVEPTTVANPETGATGDSIADASAFSEIPGGLDCYGLACRLPLSNLESLDGEVQVHQIHRSPDVAEIGFDRYHPSGLAQ
jgi:hypothetical protein